MQIFPPPWLQESTKGCFIDLRYIKIKHFYSKIKLSTQLIDAISLAAVLS